MNGAKAGNDAKRLKLFEEQIKFAKVLAGNEFNVATKQKNINKLGELIKRRTEAGELSDKERLTLWKGLFFSMWMSDKPLVQEDHALKIARLLHKFENIESSIQFFGSFLTTMANEWNGIDQWRIEKFMMLVRKVTRELFYALQTSEWNVEAIALLNKILGDTILGSSHVPRGLFMHFAELYLEELAKVSEGKITTDRVSLLLRPFMLFIAKQSDYKQIQFVVRSVFNHLLFQSEAGREYKDKYDAWKGMGFPGQSMDELVLEEPEDEETDEEYQNGIDEEENGEKGVSSGDEENTETENGVKVLDPRAGRVNVDMPELVFDAKAIIDELESYKYMKFTKTRNRKCLSRVINTFSKFTNGVFPIGIQRLGVDRENIGLPDIDEKIAELDEFDEELYGKQRVLKKLAKRKRKRIVNNQDLFDEFQAKSNKIAKFKHDGNIWLEEDISAEDELKKSEDEEHVKALHAEKELANGTPAKKAEKKIEKSTGETPKKIKSAKSPKVAKDASSNLTAEVPKTHNDTPKSAKKIKRSEWEAPLEDGEVEYIIPSKKQQCNGAPRITITKDSTISTIITPKKSDKTNTAKNETPSDKVSSPKSPKKASNHETPKGNKKLQINIDEAASPSAKASPKKIKKLVPEAELSKSETEPTTPKESKKSPKSTNAKVTSSSKKSPVEASTPLPISIQLENGLPKSSTKKQKKAKANTPLSKSVLLAQAECSTPKGMLTPSERRVKIELKMNRSQEVKEYITQLKQSPAAPYDSAKKPLKGALKPNLAPSPINPFYKRMIGMQ